MLTSLQNVLEISRINTPSDGNVQQTAISSARSFHQAISLVQRYLPATLKKNPSRGWYIEFFVFNPSTRTMAQKRYRLNKERKRYKRQSDFKTYANMLVHQINVQLALGWNPFDDNELPTDVAPVTTTQSSAVVASAPMPQQYTVASASQKIRIEAPKISMRELRKRFEADKCRELRPDTLRSYLNFFKNFIVWSEREGYADDIAAWNRKIAIQYMDYVYQEREVSGRTYNNHLKMASTLFNWAKEHCYIEDNPFEGIRKKREDKKKRILIPGDIRERIVEHLRDKDPAFLLVCELVFTALMRPKEIAETRIEDIDLEHCFIRVRSEVAKNHNERKAAFNEQVRELLAGMHLERYPKDYALFSAGLQPGEKNLGRKELTKRWQKLRKELNLPDEMQLYSLRDTGINFLIKSGVDPLTVMQHADHHDLAMTTRYANHEDDTLGQTIFEKAKF